MESLQERKSKIIDKLKELKNYNSDIPEKLIHSDNPKNKVRTGRFETIVTKTELICYWILTDEKYTIIKKELIDNLQIFCNDDFRKKVLTTKEDIIKGDQMIDKLIKVLENIE